MTDFQPLSPKVVHVWRIGLLLWALTLAAAAIAAGNFAGRPRMGAVAAAVLAFGGLTFAVFWPPARYRGWGFAVREDDVVIRRGVWWRTLSIVPHQRIQHVDTTHGPLERALGLSSVVLFTAGTVGASIAIPGLAIAVADDLRDRLAALGRSGESV